INCLPELGRWDDVLVALDKSKTIQIAALRLIQKGLNDKNALCAKWMPRQGKHAAQIAGFLKLSRKDYRKLLSGLSNTVEQKMCANQWTEIKYSHVPGNAMTIYRNAFKKHDAEGFNNFIEALKSGTTKINANTVYPYTLV